MPRSLKQMSEKGHYVSLAILACGHVVNYQGNLQKFGGFFKE